MKKVLGKLILLATFIYILYLTGITIWFYSAYFDEMYLKDEFNVGSGSLSDFYSGDHNNNLLNLLKRKDAFLYSFEYYKKDSSLVKTSMLYNSRTKSDVYNDSLEYGIVIYSFKINKDFKLNQVNTRMIKTDWYFIHSMGSANLFSYKVKQKMGLKGNLTLNSMEFYYEGEIVKEKDTLNGRLKTILIKPEVFEVGFNNERKRMIYVKPEEEKQPLHLSFYEKDDMLFVIFLSSAKNKITENSINEFILFN